MLLIRIILRSAIDGHEEVLGEATITNDGTGTHESGNYDVAILKGARYSSSPGTIWKRGRVEGFARRLGPWRLLLESLKAALAARGE